MAVRYIDFDGTLAFFDGWKGPDHFGKPIQPMVTRIKNFLAAGDEVIIFTARLSPSDQYGIDDINKMRVDLEDWCLRVFGKKLEITNVKGNAQTIYDDRAFRVVRNTGLTTEEYAGILIVEELASNRTKEQSLQRILQFLNNTMDEYRGE